MTFPMLAGYFDRSAADADHRGSSRPRMFLSGAFFDWTVTENVVEYEKRTFIKEYE